MPRTNIRPRHQRRGSTTLTDGWRSFLTLNCGRVGALAHLFDDPQFHRLFTDAAYRESAASQMWELHGDAITSDWITTHPCSRPAAWWLFDAPEPRRKIPRHYPAEQRAAIRRHSGDAALQSLLRVAKKYPSPEREREYLQRHGLLTDAECRTPRRDVCEL